MFAACEKGIDSAGASEKLPNETITENPAQHDGMMQLGKKLENPYSVENMRTAYELLSPQTRNSIGVSADKVVQTTHYYVKFHPKNEDELYVLKLDTSLILYSYPLDYDIKENGAYYHDPAIPDSLPTYQYASVKVGYQFPQEVEYEILENLYIPDEYNDDDAQTRTSDNINEEFVEELVSKSMNLTGNEDDTESMTRGRLSKWRPAGYIAYYDNTLSDFCGVEGLKVRAKRWFTTHEGIVGSDGKFTCNGKFRGEVDYTVDLERDDFQIMNDKDIIRISTDNRRGSISWCFYSSQDEMYDYITAFRAAYHYYYKHIGSLSRPPMNTFWRSKLKIHVHRDANTASGDFTYTRILGLFNRKEINIYNNNRLIEDEYSTVIHEFAHAVHWAKDRDLIFDVNLKVKESWAVGVQWYLTKMIYPNYRGFSDWSNYTNVVMDLMDTENDHSNNEGKNEAQGDSISEVPISEIETALNGCTTWEQWRNNIKQNYDNEKQEKIEALFAVW